MRYIFRNAEVYSGDKFLRRDVLIENGLISDVAPSIQISGNAAIFDFHSFILTPGLLDVHVHLREPGFSYKETIATGTAAAAAGGFTAVCAMPNLSPVPDSAAHLQTQLALIRDTAAVRVIPYGAITVNEDGRELADMAALAPFVAGYSDDGRGVESEALMRRAMESAARLNKIISAHCEDKTLTRGGYIHDGEYAKAHGHIGIPSESEWKPIERDLKIAEETGCAYHVCHVSCRESVELIRRAKARGVNVTCETAPHYLILTDTDLQEDGRFKMNPPIRSADDRAALVEGILDGTIDMIITDHAPHSAEEKSGGLANSAMGVVGLETAFAEMYTHLVKPGIITLEKLIELMSINPGRRFGMGTEIAVGQPADLAAFELDTPYRVDPDTFKSKGRATPFAGDTVYGRCRMTMVEGRIVWQENITEK
jgi:dihydroorotase